MSAEQAQDSVQIKYHQKNFLKEYQMFNTIQKVTL
jgi:hypothetical protein